MNILITRHDKIGDFILTLPMIKIAKEQLPNYNIIVLVSKINYELAKSLNFIDDVILYDNNLLSLTTKIKEKQIDVSISAFTDTKLAIALFLAGVKKRYAPATKFAQLFANYRVVQRRSKVQMREFEYNIALLQNFKNDIKIDFKKPLLSFNQNEKNLELIKFKQQFNITENFEYVAFHPGFGGSSDGNLIIDDYIKLAKSISHKKNIKVIFTFGPDDKESKEYIEKNIDFSAILYDSHLPLINFCKLISNFKIFVSTSTGPMHLAGAVNIHTISFFGISLFASAKRWGSINNVEFQNNYSIPLGYDRSLYNVIENRLDQMTNG